MPCYYNSRLNALTWGDAMLNRNICAALVLWVTLTACGPDTIFVRPNLDTPERHVSNGQALLHQGKIQDAEREFKHAHAMDPENVGALVGMALVQGHGCKFEQGFATIEQAEKLVVTEDDRILVRKGLIQLKELRRNQ